MLTPIGIISSCFKEKFGIPRQPGLVPEARAVLKLKDTPEFRQALRGLEEVSHIWVVFVFHEAQAEGWRPLVRPPRLGGAKKLGVFATRSPHRPNPIGISVVRLESIQGTELVLRGGDFLEGTPVLDIKPYVPYADSVSQARLWATQAPKKKLKVTFSREASLTLQAARGVEPSVDLKKLIRQTLALDPRPAHQVNSNSDYAFRVAGVDVHWQMSGRTCHVTRILGD